MVSGAPTWGLGPLASLWCRLMRRRCLPGMETLALLRALWRAADGSRRRWQTTRRSWVHRRYGRSFQGQQSLWWDTLTLESSAATGGWTNFWRFFEILLSKDYLSLIPFNDLRWSSMRRTRNETIARLLVREEELFVDLQQSLRRARHEREGLLPPDRQPDPTPHMGTTPSQSPTAGAGTTSASSPTRTMADETSSPTGGYFEDELRGYCLLKSSRLWTAERQHILTMTGNSTRYHFVRRALLPIVTSMVVSRALRERCGLQKIGKKHLPWDDPEQGDWWDDEEAYWSGEAWYPADDGWSEGSWNNWTLLMAGG